MKELVQLVVDNEYYDDIGGGSDCGLFELFPHFERLVKIRDVDREEEEDDSIGSLADFIEDDCNSNQDEYEEDEEEESEEESDDEDIVDIVSDEDIEEKAKHRKNKKRESKDSSMSKRRKIIVISSDSDCYICFTNKLIRFLF